MARQRQGQGASRSLWERAGARAGDGAGALFARLDAQDALDGRETQATQDHQAREQAAATLERLAARIRAGAWSDELATLVTHAARLSDS